MSVSIPFSNAKPKLLGVAEDSEGIIVTPAVPGLSGSLVLNDTFFTNDILRGGSAIFSGNTEDISSEDTLPFDITISNDGLKVFLVGDNTNTIYQYNMSVANDLSTASYSGNFLDVSTEDINARGVAISTDGLTLFYGGGANTRIYQYNLTVANDLSTASFSGNSLLTSPEDTTPRGIDISFDGLTIFMVGSGNDTIYQYDLLTPDDLSSASFSGNSLDISFEDTDPRPLTLASDGLTIFIGGSANDKIYQYDMSVANDLSTASFSGNTLDVSPQDTDVRGVAISSDGLTLFYGGNATDTIYQYDLSVPGQLGSAANYGFFANQTITTEFAQVNAGTLKVGTRVVCVVTGLVGTDLDLERNGSTITTLVPVVNPNVGQPDFYSSFVDTITVEAPYTYGLRIPLNPVTLGSTVLLVFPIEPDDTHAGIIATPAVPGKQINAADSHRTHEQSILPD